MEDNNSNSLMDAMLVEVEGKVAVGHRIMEFLSPRDKDLVALAGTGKQVRCLVESYCKPKALHYEAMVPQKHLGDFRQRINRSYEGFLNRLFGFGEPLFLFPAASAGWCLWNMFQDPILIRILACHQKLAPFCFEAAAVNDCGYMENIMGFFSRSEIFHLAQVSKVLHKATETYCARKCAALRESAFLQEDDRRLNRLETWLERQKQEFRQSMGTNVVPSSRWTLSKMLDCPLEMFSIAGVPHGLTDFRLHTIDASNIFVAFRLQNTQDYLRRACGGALWNIEQENNDLVFFGDDVVLARPHYIPQPVFQDENRSRLLLCDLDKYQEEFNLAVHSKSTGDWESVFSIHVYYSEYQFPINDGSGMRSEHFAFFSGLVDGTPTTKYCGWINRPCTDERVVVGDVILNEEEGSFSFCNGRVLHSLKASEGHDATLTLYNKKWLLLNFVSETEYPGKSAIAVFDLEKGMDVSVLEGFGECYCVKADPESQHTIYALGAGESRDITISRLHLDEDTGKLSRVGSWKIEGLQIMEWPFDTQRDVFDVDFASDTVVLAYGHSLYVCNGKHGAIKRKNNLQLPLEVHEDWVPSVTVVQGHNMYALSCGPNAFPSLHFLNE